MAIIDIKNVINVSLTAPLSGLAAYSINNLLMLTKDTPLQAIGDYKAYLSLDEVITDWGTSSTVYKNALAVFSQAPNVVSGDGRLVVAEVGAETITEAAARVKGLVFFGGFGWDFTPADLAEATDAMTWAQANAKLCGVNSNLSTDLDAGELLAYPSENTLFYTRPFYYSVDVEKAAQFMWGYLSRAMSVVLTGSNTTLTMNLKQLSAVAADSGLTQTLLDTAKTVGADVYASIAGRASVLSHGANQFFDSVYNRVALKGDVEVGGFNYLALTSGKIPQTEAGMSGLKGAYREVCDQYVTNGTVAPGEYNGPVPFGDPEDFKRNIRDFGYYIYSQPIAEQAQAERADRIAPLVQIAIKEAGAIHKGTVIINVQP